MSNTVNKIIGKGWAFPPTFELTTKQVVMVSGEQDIIESLQVLFGTRPGERVLEQKYGCDISVAMFQNITLSEQTFLESKIKQAIINFESRINLHSVNVDTNQAVNGTIYIQIDFSIDGTNSRKNIVYPYFIGEGTLLARLLFKEVLIWILAF